MMQDQNKFPPSSNEEDEQYKRAQAKVAKLKAFYKGLITFVWVNILLLLINLYFNPHNLWFYWVTIIWGFVLIIQALKTFAVRDNLLGEEWEKRKIQELLDKEKRKKQ